MTYQAVVNPDSDVAVRPRKIPPVPVRPDLNYNPTEQELRECLERTLLSLPQLQSSVLLLRERQGLELEQICNLLDISLSNARVLVHRARLKVFATVEHFEETGEC